MSVNSPSDVLSEIIVPLLVENKLLLPEDAERLKNSLAKGSLKSEDWLLTIEKAQNKERYQ